MLLNVADFYQFKAVAKNIQLIVKKINSLESSSAAVLLLSSPSS